MHAYVLCAAGDTLRELITVVYFVVYMLVMSFVLLSLFVAVILEYFEKAIEDDELLIGAARQIADGAAVRQVV